MSFENQKSDLIDFLTYFFATFKTVGNTVSSRLLWKPIVILIIILSWFYRAEATHVYGADFFYKHLKGNTYRISLVVYGDCSGSAFPSLDSARAMVTLYQGTNEFGFLTLEMEGPGVEVTPICSKLLGQSNCKNDTSTIPGVTRYIYSTEYDLPYRAADWIFYFGGNMGKSQAGRSFSITNIDNAAAVGTLTLTALLNNLTLGTDNSSPIFTTIPTPFYCINKQQYNQGAVDPDGDSLVYELVPAMTGKYPVRYDTGYSATKPLSTVPGSFKFDSLTGQLNFTPDQIQRSLVVTRVTEYRKGVIVGTALREMTFIVIGNCDNSPVFNRIDTTKTSLLGGVADGPGFFACTTTDSIHFNIIPEIPVSDSILVDVHGLPPGANLIISGNKTSNPVISVGWKTLLAPAGSYNFFVSYTDNDCPLNSRTFQAYTITLTPQPIASITGPDTLCHNEIGTFRFDGKVGKGPLIEYIWDWDHPIHSEGHDAGPWQISWNSEKEKHVLLRVVENHCASNEFEKVVKMKPSPYAVFALPEEVCQHDSVKVEFIANRNGAWVYHWNFGGADIPRADDRGPYIVRWHEAGKKRVSLSATWNGCTDSSTYEIIVHPAPQAEIANAPETVCIGDKLLLKARGGVEYSWSSAGSRMNSYLGELSTQIFAPSVYRVLVESEYGCFDSASIRYDNIEPCCQFSYPNAFTPNNDGRNDRFRVVTYGNHKHYELSIFDQWGQRVYYGVDAESGWDGSFNGKPCAIGTYFYYLNATCYTGRQETHKGDLMLIR